MRLRSRGWQAAADSGNSGNTETAVEKIPLKSHMKNKAQRVPELRKAVARFIARGETKQSAYELLNSTLETLVGKAGKIIYMSRIMMIYKLFTYVPYFTPF